LTRFTNIAAYRFVSLTALKPLRQQLYVACRSWGLKGTILLSAEGINLFVAGPEEAVNGLWEILRGIAGLEGLEGKISFSDEQPFTRMLVKIKKEIIPFGIDGIDPVNDPAPRIAPSELKRWLDEGRPVTLLDTRNDFEVRLGTFRDAQAIGIEHFRDFPRAADQWARQERGHGPVVTFCTGGIRCEKAAPYLRQLGLSDVYQLDGGILKYFEECGGDHFRGECFVFDKRVGVSADLEESGHGFCHACQSVLAPEELDDPRMVDGVSCPRCHRPADEECRARIEQRQQRLREVAEPLPGSIPQDNLRPLKIHARHEGWSILEVLGTVLGGVSLEEWGRQIEDGHVLDADHRRVAASHRVKAGDRYYTCEKMQVEPAVDAGIVLLHEDDAIVVVDKPAPLPTHPSGRYHRNTLEWFLRQVYAPQKPRPAHRLDANTTGVVVFTRTAHFARRLQPQFERGEIQKEYLARVLGSPPDGKFDCRAPIRATVARLGARLPDPAGQPAHTEFEVIHRFDDGTSLVRVWPRSGRTNQIRVHLWSLGWPIVGDAMYCPGGTLGHVQTIGPEEPPLGLHAFRLTFRHPQTDQIVTFEAPPPAWARIEQDQ
jgi:RluA family pseudouridine synthase